MRTKLAALSTPRVWYQGSYLQATYLAPHARFHMDASAYLDATESFHALQDTWEAFRADRVWRPLIARVFWWGAGASFRDISEEPEVPDEMPLIDYTDEAANLIAQPTATGAYRFIPSSLGESHII